MRQLVPLVLVSAAALCQTSQVLYAPDGDGSGPTFTSETVSISYPGSYSSIRQVDFRNFNFLALDHSGKLAKKFSLKNGHFKHDQVVDHSSIDLDSIHYFRTSTSSTVSSALVLYSWFAAGGSSSQGGTAEVFTVSNGHLRSVQQINWDTHFDAGQPTDSFDPRMNTLVIRSAHYVPGDANCCISAMDVVTFRWDGARLVQSGIQTELSEYGKREREGKTLPH